jgi:flagellar basal body-associated protein FliL
MEIDRAIKRLAVILVVCLIIIAIAKVMLGQAITNAGQAAAARKQQAVVPPPDVLPASQPIETFAATPEPAPASATEAAVAAPENPVSAPEAAPVQ